MPDIAEAKQYVQQLADSVCFYKIGLELFAAGNSLQLIDWLHHRDKRIFLDLKLFDVPTTVARAVKQLRELPVQFMTVHGNDAILKAAVQSGGSDGPGILSVTALTSLDEHDLQDLGFACDAKKLVLSRARRALECGCAGVVCSGLEAAHLRQYLGNGFMIVTPGIRPVYNDSVDDQKRVVSVVEALTNGADYLVIGRPIRDAESPSHAAEEIQKSIELTMRKLKV